MFLGFGVGGCRLSLLHVRTRDKDQCAWGQGEPEASLEVVILY